MSTTPLREALRRLAAEGMVELKSHSDARVASLTAEEARDLYVIRGEPRSAGSRARGREPDAVGHQKKIQATLNN